MRSRSILAGVLAASLGFATTGCATTGGDGTAISRARGQCAAAVLIGAIGGAIIGNNTGSGNSGRGALVGAGAGGVLCAVLMAMASEEDQRRIAETEAQALEAGESRQTVYLGADGRQRTVTVDVAPAQDPDYLVGAPSAGDAATPASTTAPSGPRICRTKQTDLAVAGLGQSALDAEVLCRDPVTLAWVPTRVPA